MISDDDAVQDDDDDVTQGDDDDITATDDDVTDDDITDDDDNDAEFDTFSVHLTTDCDGIDQSIDNPIVFIGEIQVGHSPITTDVIEGHYLFQAYSEIALIATYYDYWITEDQNFHFLCGLAPEGLFDLYSEPCGMGGNYIGTFEVGTVIIDNQVKMTVNGEPSYTIIGSGYYNDDDLDNVLGLISTDLTEIGDYLDDNCGYLQE